MDRLSIPKTTGTHADVFAAAGLADLLSSVTSRCMIVDRGPDFCVEVEPAVTQQTCEQIEADAGFLFLRPNEKTAVPPAVCGRYLDYPAEKARATRYNSARIDARKAGAELAEDIAADAPRPDWRLYQALNALQGDDGTNKVVLQILHESPAKFREAVWVGIEALRKGDPAELSWPVTVVQLFNPQAAKGYARLKPDSTDRNDSTKNAWGDPFLEWLRYRGYFRAACPYFLGSKGENVRLLCPVPLRIDVRLLIDAVAELRKRPIFGSAAKLDSLGVLNLAEILVQRSEPYQSGGFSPAQAISGVTVTHYQSMGQAKAVTGVEQLALPDWFPILSQDDADAWIEILNEHRAVIRSLRDDRSDEIGLLLSYRRYLEKRGKKALLTLANFVQDYGIFLIRERERGRRLKRFQTVHLERIFMHEECYSSILGNPGFLAVAAAIRSATVSAQSMKAMKRPGYRDIRYDLLPELRRKGTLPGVGAFLQAVGGFVASYNAESARRFELGKGTGTRRVTTEELDAFVQLVTTQKNASVVGALLCAYATCREPKAQEDVPVDEVMEGSNVEA